MIYSRYIFKIISFWCLIFLKTSLSDCRDRRTSVNDAGILYSGETETNWGNRRQLQLQSSEYEAANSLGCIQIQQYRDITRPYTSHYSNDQLSSCSVEIWMNCFKLNFDHQLFSTSSKEDIVSIKIVIRNSLFCLFSRDLTVLLWLIWKFNTNWGKFIKTSSGLKRPHFLKKIIRLNRILIF